MKTIYEFSVKDRKGKDVSLKEYANEVLLIVNTAYSTSPATSSDSRHLAQTRASMSSVSSTSVQSSPVSRR